jgi:hypothetical protein
MKKSHSQEIALLFMIVDALFLIPLLPTAICTFPLLLFYGVLSFFGLFTREFASSAIFLTFILILFGVTGFGLHLMYGYFKHFKNYLTPEKTDRLWIKTIIYNAVFFLPAFYVRLQCWFTENCPLENRFTNELSLLTDYPFILSALTLWWFLAIFLSFSALASIGQPTSANTATKLDIS